MSKIMLYLGVLLAIPSASVSLETTAPETPEPEKPFLCADCGECSNPNRVGYAVSSEPDPVTWVGYFYCPEGWRGACDEMGSCEGGQTDEEDLQAAVETADPRKLVDILERPRVFMVAERSEIQVMDCQGDHVAYQVSINPDVLNKVTQLQDE